MSRVPGLDAPPHARDCHMHIVDSDPWPFERTRRRILAENPAQLYGKTMIEPAARSKAED